MHGVVVIDKPAGLTSHDVVGRVRRRFGIRRVGHAGTLDPLATGVLVICIGSATRIVEYLSEGVKAYTAAVAFGVATDTQDVTGTVVATRDAAGVCAADVERAAAQFRGSIAQTPPMVSAVHHEGRRLYELARQGVEVERAARPVEVHRLEVSGFVPGSPAGATLDIECGGGTYVRTLAADIGDALGVGGMMTALRRTRVGRFTLADAIDLDALAGDGAEGAVLSVEGALSDWPAIHLDADGLSRVRHGQEVAATAPGPHERADGLALLLDPDGRAAAIARRDDTVMRPIKVLCTDA